METYGSPMFIRGDFNVNPNNKPRVDILSSFTSRHSISGISTHHPTHHHFMGDGASDTQLDLLLSTHCESISESLINIVCKLENPLVDSSHDIHLSQVSLSPLPTVSPVPPSIAPRLPNDRVKITWDPESTEKYQLLLSSILPTLRNTLGSTQSPSCISIFMQITNSALSAATNKVTHLGEPWKPRSQRNREMESAQTALLSAARAHRHLLASQSPSVAEVSASNTLVATARATLQRLSRAAASLAALERDSLLDSALARNPRTLHRAIKAQKSSNTPTIHKLNVGNLTFEGPHVPDGFFYALKELKDPDFSSIHSTPEFISASSILEIVLEICESGSPIPPIS
jgi:hypothetical protein